MDGREKDPLTVATPIPLLSHQPGAERVQADIGTTAAHASVQPGTTIPTFSAEEKQALLGIARRVLEQVVADLIPPQLQVNHFSANLAQRRACFVTLTRGGELRGCIGQLTTEKPLYEAVADHAAGAASRDLRFGSVERDELPDIRIEISVLSDPRPLVFASPADLLAQLQPYRDGVVLRIGARISTFLPQVWERIPEKIEFLDRLAQKAGCHVSAWREPDANISIYQAESFEEPSPAHQYA